MEQRLKPYSPVRRLGAIATAVTSAAVAVMMPSQKTILPFERWPDWAKAISKERRSTDKGIGDTVKHAIGDERSDKFTKWFANNIGRSCGCLARQHWLNARFSYLDFHAGHTS